MRLSRQGWWLYLVVMAMVAVAYLAGPLYDEERIPDVVRAAFGRHTAGQFYIRFVRNLVRVPR